MKKSIVLISLLLLFSLLCSCAGTSGNESSVPQTSGAEQSVYENNIVEGNHTLYLYESMSLSTLSERLGRELEASPKEAADAKAISTGTVVSDRNGKKKTVVVVGDTDCDGVITAEDAVLALQLAYETKTASEAVLFAADINGDGKVSGYDAEKILYVAASISRADDVMSARINDYYPGQILVRMQYEQLNPDFSVYTPAYFGDAFTDCAIYDLYADYGLFLVLQTADSSVDTVEHQIRALMQREDVAAAQKCLPTVISDLTPYNPNSKVKLLNRYAPYTDEFTRFSYARRYRMSYYSVDYSFSVLVSEDDYSEWLAVYRNQCGNDYHEQEPNKMAMQHFIEYFQIPKETMDAKIREIQNERDRKDKPDFYWYTELGELPNTDILYTFDTELINDYYRYD